MRTRTTYLALLATLLTGTALTVVSCTPDATAPGATSVVTIDPNVTQAKVQQLRDKYGWMGQYHTDGLSYIYTQLAKGAGKPRSKDEICRIAAKAAKEFHKKNRGSEVPATFVDASLLNEVCGEASTSSSINRTVVSGFIDIHAPRTDLSYAATSYLDQLAALPISSTSRAQFLSSVYSIESQAAATLSESEAGAVTAVASIAISSANYWEVNLNSWLALGPAVAYTKASNGRSGGTEGLTPVYGWGPMARNMGKVIGADIVGGARTVATGWFLGPIAWDAAAVSALWASGVAVVALM
jgi:hypothetical protein